jgi:FkbM family methyltransferase
MLSFLEDEIRKQLRGFICRKLGIGCGQFGIPVPLLKHLKKGQHITLVDVGAYEGDFTRALEQYVRIGKGILIEPLPNKAEGLRKTFDSVEYRVLECALSPKCGFIELEVNEFEQTSSVLKIRRGIAELSGVNVDLKKTIQCRTCTLDDVIFEEGLDSVDLLKIDVQGAEHLILAGGRKTLDITSMIWIEVSFKPLYEMSSTFFDIYKLLYDVGFKFCELEPGFRGSDGELLQGNALFIRK